jgi:hypothetical protein
MKEDDVKQCLIQSCKDLCAVDLDLLEVDANERSITHQLAIHIKKYFPQYDVDCEYNRNGLEPKRLDGLKTTIESDDTNATTVYPDIIIHNRQTSKNFVVIEAKKIGYSLDSDKQKLKLYKSQLGYEYAFLVTFTMGILSDSQKRYAVEAIT